MVGETPAALLDVHHVINYVFNTRSLGYKTEPKEEERTIWYSLFHCNFAWNTCTC